MATNRVRIAKDKAELVQVLVKGEGTTGLFQTYADVIAFAAALGAKEKKRVPLGLIAKEPAPISLEIFVSRGYDSLIKLLALWESEDTQILSTYESDAEIARVEILEEYANAGLEKLQEDLRGARDYTERILLILGNIRLSQPEPAGEFDLSRFLGAEQLGDRPL